MLLSSVNDAHRMVSFTINLRLLYESMKYESKYDTFRVQVWIWECHLKNGGYFVSATMCWCGFIVNMMLLRETYITGSSHSIQ